MNGCSQGRGRAGGGRQEGLRGFALEVASQLVCCVPTWCCSLPGDRCLILLWGVHLAAVREEDPVGEVFPSKGEQS